VTLLIDPPNAAGHGRLWSHLASDASYDELHVFAASLGIPRRGFDRDHYDIPAERYDAVVAAGATPVSSRELIRRLTAAGLRRRKADLLRPKPPGHSLVRPPRLRVGDPVAVVSPSGPVPPDLLAAGVDVLGSWGLDVRVSARAAGRLDRFGYLSADDETRAAELTAAWCDPDVRAVVCARGGYGAQRMVDLLDWERLAAAGPKVLLGFSDVTALHQAFAARLGLSTLHGPVVSSLGRADEATRTHLRAMLLDPVPGTSLTPAPATTLVPGAADGVLVGGNLALLAAGVGAPAGMGAAESIVVLEDVAEEVYRIDRLLTQLLRSGWFDGVRGVALGDFTDCASPAAVRDLVLDRLGPLGVPMVAGVPVGHETRNLAFPLGVPAVLDADAGTLVLRDAALR
jgi:muramoyltetrapeptide carboxypeptidase